MIFPGLGQVSYKKFIQITLAAALAGGARCCWIIIITNVGVLILQKVTLLLGKHYKRELISVEDGSLDQ